MSNRSFSPLRLTLFVFIVFFVFAATACGKKDASGTPANETTTTADGESVSTKETSASADYELTQAAGARLSSKFGTLSTPSAPGTVTQGNDVVTIDTSNSGEGYFFTNYTGNNPKVKLQLTGPDNVTYTYNIKNGETCLPISAGDGSYTIAIYENISDDQYSTAYSGNFTVTLTNAFGPYLYPNQYVNYTSESNAVMLASDFAVNASSDLETVCEVYHYITDNIVYDKEEAKTVTYDYLPDVDEVLQTKKGICFDYAALMAAMLRSQGIPTRLHVGYAGDAYHAWINVYIEDIGWIDGIIQFDGKDWSLMDPTFAANKNSKSTQDFIGDGNNYNTLYTY